MAEELYKQEKPRVLVMMATYNGQEFLSEQIESILRQEDVLVTLRICDDISSDDSFAICEEYANKYSNVIATQNQRRKGVGENFMQMVYEDIALDCDYFAFSDQDDVWLPNKLKAAVSALKNTHSSDEPTLYFSDMVNFSDKGEWRELAGFELCEQKPYTLLLRNWVDGCSMVFNKALLMLLRSKRPTSWPRYHDVWVHMVARFCGSVIGDYSHVHARRRLHGANTVGGHSRGFASTQDAVASFRNLFTPSQHPMVNMAKMFLAEYSQEMRDSDQKHIQAFVDNSESIKGRFRIALSKDYWLPSLRSRMLMGLAEVLNRH
ncbi:MAG: glycosyltransferase [Atopobiaceae bacterium]|nr:glycosyltransferase [Atopobiaceae bacterium]